MNDNIFNSITEIDDEIIYLNNGDDDYDDENPSICSVSQLLENYIKFNNHLSFSTLLKIILSYDDENLIDNNVYLYFHKIFLPNHSRTNAISII